MLLVAAITYLVLLATFLGGWSLRGVQLDPAPLPDEDSTP